MICVALYEETQCCSDDVKEQILIGKRCAWGTPLARSVEHAALDRRIVSSDPMLRVEPAFKQERERCTTF